MFLIHLACADQTAVRIKASRLRSVSAVMIRTARIMRGVHRKARLFPPASNGRISETKTPRCFRGVFVCGILFAMVKDKIIKSNEEWRRTLAPDVYYITREKGTEPAFTGTYYAMKDKGMYRCSNCGVELFSSDTKYDSGSGWPSFTAPIGEEAVETTLDTSNGMDRTEIMCARCGAHLGHVFDDMPRRSQGKAGGPSDKTGLPAQAGKRFCVNSASLQFEKSK